MVVQIQLAMTRGGIVKMRTRMDQAIAAIETAAKLSSDMKDLIELREQLQMLEAQIIADRTRLSSQRRTGREPERR